MAHFAKYSIWSMIPQIGADVGSEPRPRAADAKFRQTPALWCRKR